ncbi:MAG: phosphotransferase family protein [Sphingopyxis sp.]|nr:phosphotransferase family protein [Sphingopyxis sp.]
MPLATARTPCDAADHFLPEAEVSGFDREGVSRHLAGAGLDFDPRQPFRQFSGGLANRNYLVEIDGRPAVLRRPPAGPLPPGAHDMAREHRVLTGLSACLPFVPQSLHYCPDRSVIGVPFQIVEYRSGLVVRDALPPGRDAVDVSARLSQVLVDTIAQIHAVDSESCGLSGLGRPQGFVDRAVAGWTKRGLLVADEGASAIVEALGRWLSRRPFRDEPHGLIHLDFKLDNMILDPGTLEVRAVIDWDMGTVGNTLFDFSAMLSYWGETGDPPALTGPVMMPTAQPGFWTRTEASARYCELTGRDPANLADFRILALFRLAVVYLQLHRQWADGRVKGARYEGFRDRGEQLLAHVWDMARERPD